MVDELFNILDAPPHRQKMLRKKYGELRDEARRLDSIIYETVQERQCRYVEELEMERPTLCQRSRPLMRLRDQLLLYSARRS